MVERLEKLRSGAPRTHQRQDRRACLAAIKDGMGTQQSAAGTIGRIGVCDRPGWDIHRLICISMEFGTLEGIGLLCIFIHIQLYNTDLYSNGIGIGDTWSAYIT